MNNEKDELKECIAREFEEIAKEEEESLEKDTSLVVPEGTKEAVLARLKEQMIFILGCQKRKQRQKKKNLKQLIKNQQIIKRKHGFLLYWRLCVSFVLVGIC